VKGLALDRLGKTNEAIEFYNKALTIDPRNYIALTGKKIDLNTTTSSGCRLPECADQGNMTGAS
jgi:tetratricopeptide (TPR) repeat protein